MRILFLTHAPKGKGTYFRCFFLANYLAKSKHEVWLTCLNPKATVLITKEKTDIVNVLLPRQDRCNLGELPFHLLRSMINFGLSVSIDFDIVHYFSVGSPTTALPVFLSKALRIRNSKIFIDWDDWWGRGGLTKGRRAAESMATLLEEKVPFLSDGVTVVSEALKQRALSLGVSCNVYKVPNGANIDFIKPLDKYNARLKLGLPLEKKILCCIGLYDATFDLTIRAFKEINKSVPNVLLTIVGSFKAKYLKVIDNLNLTKNVIYTGVQPYDRVPFYLGASDILLFPMANNIVERARWPIRMGDYLAAARPIVATGIGEVKRVIEKERCGLLSKPDDAKDFAKKVRELSDDARLCKDMSIRARKAAEEKYSWRIIAGELEHIYEQF